MEDNCPNCLNLVKGENPDGYYIVYDCDVCGCEWDGDGLVLARGNPELKAVHHE